ncbi:MAG: hypothetical protein A3F17_07825 [Gammaproteobacteria bacterium RIFCSPHIGHO2_12_FULL_41_15]|nr:MAG: hypothetical protein A3F17_07825 [Gammaproteobacteria bacterium RIFCSPHIGHO2_12_FULL_41_15]
MGFFNKLVAVFCPAIILFVRDNPFGGLLALALQSTVIGWPIAVIWALKILKKEREEALIAKAKEERNKSVKES